jgi:hypothetical protein
MKISGYGKNAVRLSYVLSLRALFLPLPLRPA